MRKELKIVVSKFTNECSGKKSLAMHRLILIEANSRSFQNNYQIGCNSDELFLRRIAENKYPGKWHLKLW